MLKLDMPTRRPEHSGKPLRIPKAESRSRFDSHHMMQRVHRVIVIPVVTQPRKAGLGI